MLKKYILSMLLALTLVLSFAGCNAGVISTAPSETATVSQTVTTALSETQSSTEKEKTTKAVPTSAAPSVSITEETQPSSVITTAAKKAKTTVTAATEKKTKKKKNKKLKDNNKSVKNKATAEQTENRNEQKCTVTIECSEIYRNLNKLKEGHERFLPENGVFVNKYECKINEGDTVYDVIQRAAKTKNLKVTVKNTQYGLYISGINELDEFDVGNTSGWVYYLNGEFGRVSAGNCPVKNGDDILFKYTCGE